MAPIAPVTQVYCTAHFDWLSTSHWMGEAWQIGMRLACVPKIGAPGMGDAFELAPSAAAESKSVTGSYTAAAVGYGTVDFSQTWDARWNYAGEGFALGLNEMKGIVEAYLTYHNAIRGSLSSKSRLVSVKIAPINSNGKYAAGASEFRLRTPRVGAETTNVLPPELAVAQSVGADILGRRGRGRWFVGGLTAGVALAPDGTVSTTFADTLNAAAKALIDGIQAIDNSPLASGQMICAVTSAGSATAIRPSYVRVGNHADAQRRRQHQIPESYHQTSL